MRTLGNRMEGYVNNIENYLEAILPKTTIPPINLHEAMHYAVTSGGKKVRSLLVYASGEEALQIYTSN